MRVSLPSARRTQQYVAMDERPFVGLATSTWRHRPIAARWLQIGLAGAMALSGCHGSASAPARTGQVAGSPVSAAKPAPPRQISVAEALTPHPELAPERRALLVLGTPEHPEERWVDAAAITSVGYTLIDFSNDWTPTIFAPQIGADGQLLSNRYRRILLGLSNDQLDEDGEPLPAGSANYLELYGAFPSLAVLRARFMADEQHPCGDEASVAALEAVETVTYIPPADLKKNELRLARIRKELDTAQRKAKLATLEELATSQPTLAPKVQLLDKRAAEAQALTAVEKRLNCEGLLSDKSRHETGVYDEPMRLAVRRFQQKHMIYEANFLRRKTVDALARPLLDNDYDALVRALRERVVSAAAIIEDGSAAQSANLVDEYLKVALDQLRLPNAQAALAFFKRHGAGEFTRLRAAIKLPPPPDYYSANMDLSIVIDRGDVWYDPPFDAQGQFKPQARKRYPSLTLFVGAGPQRRALARWRTTIGGWRAEQATNGYEYLRYKMSDVGPRVIRSVVAGPVWIAPPSTPIRGLVKAKTVNGKWTSIVNYDELGPGYLSAYGLIAGYFVIPGQNGRPDWDNGVRAHGSSDYLSIYSANGFSHGCHRLPNHIAIRLYSFILHHRAMRVAGDQPLGFSRQFLWKENVYEMRLPSRGFLYELDPPLPVNVLEGTIRGERKTPILGYVPEPWTQYPPGPTPGVSDSPEAKAGGGGEQ
jgi:hypothetical protein